MVRKRRTALAVGKLRVASMPKENLVDTPTEMIRGDVAPWRVSTRASTLLDLIRHKDTIGGLEAIARIAKDLAPKIGVTDLMRAVEAHDQVISAQRLGFILEGLGQERLCATVDK